MIKKYFEFFKNDYQIIDFDEYLHIKNDNLFVDKIFNILNLKYGEFNLTYYSNHINLIKTINNTTLLINIKSNDDYIYLSISYKDNRISYKCDQLSGFKSFLKGFLDNMIKINLFENLLNQYFRNKSNRSINIDGYNYMICFKKYHDTSKIFVYSTKHYKNILELELLLFYGDKSSITIKGRINNRFIHKEYNIDLPNVINSVNPLDNSKELNKFFKRMLNEYIPNIVKELD